MPSFVSFYDILPDPNHKVGLAGQSDQSTGQAGAGFANVKLASINPVMNSSHNSARKESKIVCYHKWGIDIDYNLLTCAQFYPIYAFLLHRQSTLQPFYVSLPQYFNQDITNKTVSGNHLKNSETLLITGTGVTPGVMMKEVSSTHTKVYMVTRVETNTEYFTPEGAPGSGKERLHLTPALQRDVDSGATITFTDPTIKVVHVGDVLDYDMGLSNRYSYQVKLEEVGT